MSAKGNIYIKAGAAVGPHGDVSAGQRRRLGRDAGQPPLDALRKEWCQQSLRQASRMVEMGVVGAALLRRQLLTTTDLSNLALYVGTGLGELTKNNALFAQVLPPADGMASPFDFINSSANTTAFYVAREWGFNGRNLTLSAGDFSFETALQRAVSDMGAEAASSVMVGGIDEYLAPRELHLDRLGLPESDESILGEGCGWLYLDRKVDNAIARLISIFECVDNSSKTTENWTQIVDDELDRHNVENRSCVLLPGSGIDTAQIELMRKAKVDWTVWDYSQFCGRFPTAAAFGIAASLESDTLSGKTLAHINRDAFGKTVGVIYERLV